MMDSICALLAWHATLSEGSEGRDQPSCSHWTHVHSQGRLEHTYFSVRYVATVGTHAGMLHVYIHVHWRESSLTNYPRIHPIASLPLR